MLVSISFPGNSFLAIRIAQVTPKTVLMGTATADNSSVIFTCTGNHGISESSHGISESSHGISESSHGISVSSHGISESSHGISESSHETG